MPVRPTEDAIAEEIAVWFREKGAIEWSQGLPLDFVGERNGIRCFAGSVLNLRPGNVYEIEADEGKYGGRITVETRRLPMENPPKSTVIYVYPAGYRGKKKEPAFDFRTACSQVRPGTVILIHPGTYVGPFEIAVSGTVEQPIFFRNAGGGEVMLTNPENELGAVVTGRPGVDHIYLEGLSIKKEGMAPVLKGRNNKSWVIRQCLIFGVLRTGRNNWCITDNVIAGRYDQWRKRLKIPGGTGIKLLGRGHVVQYNRISYFYDGISTTILDAEDKGAYEKEGLQHAIDINNNFIFSCVDDAIEIDKVATNIRVFRNRIMNSLVGISLQKTRPGPICVMRNVVSNCTQDPWKISQSPNGLRIYHNTTVNWQYAAAFHPPKILNSRFLNNIFLGFRWGLKAGSGDRRTRFDFNGYRRPRDGAPIEWDENDGTGRLSFNSLKEFNDRTGNEAHGVVLVCTVHLEGTCCSVHRFSQHFHARNTALFRNCLYFCRGRVDAVIREMVDEVCSIRSRSRLRSLGRGRRAEGRGRRSEGRGRRAEGRGQRSEVGGQRSEGRGRRAEVGGQRSGRDADFDQSSLVFF